MLTEVFFQNPLQQLIVFILRHQLTRDVSRSTIQVLIGRLDLIALRDEVCESILLLATGCDRPEKADFSGMAEKVFRHRQYDNGLATAVFCTGYIEILCHGMFNIYNYIIELS